MMLAQQLSDTRYGGAIAEGDGKFAEQQPEHDDTQAGRRIAQRTYLVIARISHRCSGKLG